MAVTFISDARDSTERGDKFVNFTCNPICRDPIHGPTNQQWNTTTDAACFIDLTSLLIFNWSRGGAADYQRSCMFCWKPWLESCAHTMPERAICQLYACHKLVDYWQNTFLINHTSYFVIFRKQETQSLGLVDLRYRVISE